MGAQSIRQLGTPLDEQLHRTSATRGHKQCCSVGTSQQAVQYLQQVHVIVTKKETANRNNKNTARTTGFHALPRHLAVSLSSLTPPLYLLITTSKNPPTHSHAHNTQRGWQHTLMLCRAPGWQDAKAEETREQQRERQEKGQPVTGKNAVERCEVSVGFCIVPREQMGLQATWGNCCLVVVRTNP